MTAVPEWDVAGRTDAELAGAAAAGDRGAFAGIYDRYADRLHDFCVGMVRDRDTAADCVQDVFCTAATRLSELRDPDKLRPWLYAIARNEALRHIRDRRREQPSDDLPDTPSGEAGPDTVAARTELADLIAQAAGGLPDRDRSVLELAYRHGLDGPELAQALEVSPGTANRMVSRLRETMERSLGALLVARRAQTSTEGCVELGAILQGWDGRFTILMRKRIARHIESCSACEQDRRRLVNPVALLGGVPVFIPAPGWLRDHTLSHIQLTSASANMSTTAHSAHTRAGATAAHHPPIADEDLVATPAQNHVDGAHGRRRGLTRLVAACLATLIIGLGLTIAWLYHQAAPIAPTGVSKTAPPTSTPTPIGPLTSKPPPPPAPPTSTVTTVPSVIVPSSRAFPPVQTTAPVVPTVVPTVETSVAPPPPPPEPPPIDVPPSPVPPVLIPLPLPLPPGSSTSGGSGPIGGSGSSSCGGSEPAMVLPGSPGCKGSGPTGGSGSSSSGCGGSLPAMVVPGGPGCGGPGPGNWNSGGSSSTGSSSSGGSGSGGLCKPSICILPPQQPQ
jgi:RNA polymerase sigma factor (sigma-70 family)